MAQPLLVLRRPREAVPTPAGTSLTPEGHLLRASHGHWHWTQNLVPTPLRSPFFPHCNPGETTAHASSAGGASTERPLCTAEPVSLAV